MFEYFIRGNTISASMYQTRTRLGMSQAGRNVRRKENRWDISSL